MMKIFNRTIVAFAFIAAASLTFIQTVGASGQFKGKGNAVITVVQPVATGILMTAAGTGNASGLGQFYRMEHILLNTADGTITGDVSFVAGNGDYLTAIITGGFTSQSTASGTYTLTGGTGKFANANGSAFFSLTMTDASHFTFDFSGSLQ